MTTLSDRVTGALYGLAFGDCYGYPVEFTSFDKIVRRHGRFGPEFPRVAKISDDTQMALALWYGLDTCDPTDAASVTAAVSAEFLAWSVDPDNTRAPGVTCMTALGRQADGGHWSRATVTSSKGCGTVMRAPWIGLHPRVQPWMVSDIAQLTAALTHGHPTAIVAADVLARLTRELADGDIVLDGDLDGHVEHLNHQTTYSPWLGDLWEVAGYASPTEFIDTGIADLEATLSRIPAGVAALMRKPVGLDPCVLTGEGWTADEALATALLIVSVWGDSPQTALRRAATTGGDSDSLAAIAGALLGAAHGITAWPAHWTTRLEPRYRRELAAVRAQVEAQQIPF